MSATRYLQARRLLLRVRKRWLDVTGRSGQVYIDGRVAQYHAMWQAVSDATGCTLSVLADDVWEIERDAVKTRICNYIMEFDNAAVLELAGKKAVVHRLLQSHGLPIPDHVVFSLKTLDRAYGFLGKHPQGCVIKPGNGAAGQGVTTHLQTRADVQRAALLASLYSAELIIEAQIPGECYRVLVLEGEVVHAVRRRGLRLRGDGVSTVRRLIDVENADRRKDGRAPLDVDRDCMFTLSQQNLSLDGMPASGRDFLVKTVSDSRQLYAELRTVYDEAVTDRLCDAVRRDAERAARIIGSDFLGVDIITMDPSVPLAQSGGAINEVNTTPGLHHHYDAARMSFPSAAVRALDAILRRKAAAVVRANPAAPKPRADAAPMSRAADLTDRIPPRGTGRPVHEPT